MLTDSRTIGRDEGSCPKWAARRARKNGGVAGALSTACSRKPLNRAPNSLGERVWSSDMGAAMIGYRGGYLNVAQARRSAG